MRKREREIKRGKISSARVSKAGCDRTPFFLTRVDEEKEKKKVKKKKTLTKAYTANIFFKILRLKTTSPETGLSLPT